MRIYCHLLHSSLSFSNYGNNSPSLSFSPVISQCLWRLWVRTSTLKCSWQMECTVSGSAGSTPWMNYWSTTRKPPSSPANTERSCTSSKRCCDSHILTLTLDLTHTYIHTHTHTHYTHTHNKTPLPNCLNPSLSCGPSRYGVCTTVKFYLSPSSGD